VIFSTCSIGKPLIKTFVSCGKFNKKMKSIKSICLDSNLIQLAKLRNINISNLCNNALKSYLEINKKEEKTKEQIMREMEETKAILSVKEQELNDYLTKERITEEKEKEEIAKFKNMLHRSIRANNPMR